MTKLADRAAYHSSLAEPRQVRDDALRAAEAEYHKVVAEGGDTFAAAQKLRGRRQRAREACRLALMAKFL